MDVLVTGANGFLGGTLVRQLEEVGCRVGALVRQRSQLTFAPKSTTQVYEGDLTSAEALKMDVPKVIIHAAATSPWVGVPLDRVIHDNVEGTRSLIKYALREGVSRFFFCSTVSAFGKVDTAVISEDTPVCDPDVYGMTKLLGEEMLRDCGDNMPSLSFRLPAVIGAGAVRNWLSVALRKIARREPITIFNPNAPFNNAVYARDFGRLCLRLLSEPLVGHEMVVLGAAGRTNPRAVVERMMSVLDIEVGVDVRPSPRNSFTIDCRKAMESFGYKPMEIDAMIECYTRENIV